MAHYLEADDNWGERETFGPYDTDSELVRAMERLQALGFSNFGLVNEDDEDE